LVLAYVTVQFVRKVTGVTTTEAADEGILECIEIADSMIDFETGKSWSESDSEYKLVQLASAKLVGWLVYRGLAGAEQKADKLYQEAREVIEKLKVQSEFLRG